VRGVRGLVDHNAFDGIRAPFRIFGSESGGAWDWDTFPVLVWGTASDSLYVEDNAITLSSAAYMVADGDEAARYVFRYNALGGTTPSPWFDLHPNTFGAEIYGNTFASGGNLLSHRGGRAALFYNSTTSGTGTYNVYNNDGCSSRVASVVNNSVSFNNRQGTTGSLAAVGSSGGDRCGHPSNSLSLATWTCNGTAGGCQNIKFYLHSTSFTGSTGVGLGTLAARPANCTTGVFYWATNQSTSNLTGMVGIEPSTPISGTLYKCTSTNAWTPYYTPYTYPHPLQSGGSGVNPPTAPSNVRVIR
jgi:hypothetical protein